jgi:hypothetical protein
MSQVDKRVNTPAVSGTRNSNKRYDYYNPFLILVVKGKREVPAHKTFRPLLLSWTPQGERIS